jgi:hypothetical protein
MSAGSTVEFHPGDGCEAGYEPDPATVIGLRPGWPLPSTFGYADLPEPHDSRDVLAADLLRAPEPKWDRSAAGARPIGSSMNRAPVVT